jgi:NADPH:quinone reductase-like Zn-dependent oxidoreductase
MKSIRIHQRGSYEGLVCEDAPKPVPGAEDALVRVHATAITKDELTWDQTYQHSDGSSRLPSIPGHELSGLVETAPHDSGLKPGDAVYALTSFTRDGCAAEFVAVRAADLASKPQTADHVAAASVPLAALTAWQALFDHAQLTAGQRVLIHGAAGGVGTYAVQLARNRGAHVIVTASSRNFDFLRELGADELIDYSTERFEEKARDLDAVLDCIGGETTDRSLPLLRKGGALISIVDVPSKEKAAQLGVRGLFFIVEPNRGQLIEIGKLIDAGKLKPIVDAVFPLEKARAAFEQALRSHNRGKVVLTLRESN